MSTKHVRDMTDFMRFGLDIAVECKCGRKVELPWLPVLIKFHQRKWSMNLESAKMRFRCTGCGKRRCSHLGPRSATSGVRHSGGKRHE